MPSPSLLDTYFLCCIFHASCRQLVQYLICVKMNEARQLDVCFGKRGPKILGAVGRFFWITFYSVLCHLCSLYVVLYRGWHPVNMREVCKCFVRIKYTAWQYYLVVLFWCQHRRRHFVIACTKIRNCSKSQTSQKWPKAQCIQKRSDKNCVGKMGAFS